MAAGIIGRTRFTGDSMPRQKNAEAESDSGGTGRHRRKYFRRVATRYEKRAANYLAILTVVAILGPLSGG